MHRYPSRFFARTVFAAAFLAHGILAGAAGDALAAGGTDPDWPCIQVKVPTLSLGMMWGGPIPDDGDTLWKDDPEIRRLARQLAIRRTPLDQAADLIESYAAKLDPSLRDRSLAGLMVAVLRDINRERDRVMAGITRFTRKQQKLADAVRETRTQLSDVLAIAAPSETEDAKRRELEDALLWQTRIHDDREHTLKFVCESPVLLEQRAFELAREIANHLSQ